MASIFSAINGAVVSTLSVVTKVANAVEESISIGTDYIDNAATHNRLVGKESWILATTLELEKIESELDGNAKRRTLFDKVSESYS